MNSDLTNLLGTFIDQSDPGVIALDEQMRVRHWNKLIAQHSGLALQEAVNRNFVESLEGIDARQSKLGDTDRHLWFSMTSPLDSCGAKRFVGLAPYDDSSRIKISRHLNNSTRVLQQEHKDLLHILERANGPLMQPEKLSVISPIATGAAHAISSPIRFVFPDLKTLDGYVRDLLKVVDAMDSAAGLEQLRQLKQDMDYDRIRSDVETNTLCSLRPLLRGEPHKLFTADSREVALERQNEHVEDLMISVAPMPGMKGATVRSELHLIIRRASALQHSERERLSLGNLTCALNQRLSELNTTLEQRESDRTGELKQAPGKLYLAYAEFRKSCITATKIFVSLLGQRLPKKHVLKNCHSCSESVLCYLS